MVEIVLLDTVGLEPEFFHLPRVVVGFEALRYYLVAPEQPSYLEQASYWDILAVGTVPHDPHSILLRRIHIEKEALDWPPFEAWTEGTGALPSLLPS
jgi:hypothetical protein